MSGEMLGTPGYMAPEQLRGDSKRVGPETDVFGLGATLFEIVTLERPHSAERPCRTDPEDAARAHQQSTRALNPRLDHELCAVIEKALEKEPPTTLPQRGPARRRTCSDGSTASPCWRGVPVGAAAKHSLGPAQPTADLARLRVAQLLVNRDRLLPQRRAKTRSARRAPWPWSTPHARPTRSANPRPPGRLAYAAYGLDPTPTTLGALQRSLATIAPSHRIEAGGPRLVLRLLPRLPLSCSVPGKAGKGVLATVDGTKIADLTDRVDQALVLRLRPDERRPDRRPQRGARSSTARALCAARSQCPMNGEAFTAACFGPAGERLLLGDDIGRVHVHRVERRAPSRHLRTRRVQRRNPLTTPSSSCACIRAASGLSARTTAAASACASSTLAEVLARHGEQPAPTLMPSCLPALPPTSSATRIATATCASGTSARTSSAGSAKTGGGTPGSPPRPMASIWPAPATSLRWRSIGGMASCRPSSRTMPASGTASFRPTARGSPPAPTAGVVRIFDLGGVLSARTPRASRVDQPDALVSRWSLHPDREPGRRAPRSGSSTATSSRCSAVTAPRFSRRIPAARVAAS
jgi:hypothetical protein